MECWNGVGVCRSKGGGHVELVNGSLDSEDLEDDCWDGDGWSDRLDPWWTETKFLWCMSEIMTAVAGSVVVTWVTTMVGSGLGVKCINRIVVWFRIAGRVIAAGHIWGVLVWVGSHHSYSPHWHHQTKGVACVKRKALQGLAWWSFNIGFERSNLGRRAHGPIGINDYVGYLCANAIDSQTDQAVILLLTVVVHNNMYF